MKNIRLRKKELDIIKDTAKKVFGEDIKVYIFGSRVDSEKRGGDIDILIKASRKISLSKRLSFLAKLELKGIERNVDLLVLSPQTKLKGIYKEAMRTGVQI